MSTALTLVHFTHPAHGEVDALLCPAHAADLGLALDVIGAEHRERRILGCLDADCFRCSGEPMVDWLT